MRVCLCQLHNVGLFPASCMKVQIRDYRGSNAAERDHSRKKVECRWNVTHRSTPAPLCEDETRPAAPRGEASSHLLRLT